MEFWQGLVLISGIHLLAAASPGPDFILITQQTLNHGRRIGLLCSFGITLGLGVHVLYSVLGLATLIAHSESLLRVIKWLGGFYLIYLGWQGMQSKPKAKLASAGVPHVKTSSSQPLKSTPQKATAFLNTPSVFATVRRGFFCNVFNPKAPMYFVAMFTLVLSPDMPVWQLAAYGIWMMVLQMCWFSLVATLLSIPVLKQRFDSLQHWLNRVLGATMFGLGLNLLLRNR